MYSDQWAQTSIWLTRPLGLYNYTRKKSNKIRFGIGRFTTEEEVDYTADELIKAVNKLRDLSPLWDMMQEGIDLKSIQWGGGHH